MQYLCLLDGCSRGDFHLRKLGHYSLRLCKLLRSLRFFLPGSEEAVEGFAWKLGHGEAHAADLGRNVGDLRPHVLGYSNVKTWGLGWCPWRTLHWVAQTLDELRLVEGTGEVHL